jgi:hypothetical protein
VKFGLIGPSYEMRSKAADSQKTINLYPELVESKTGKNSVILHGTPGLSSFATVDDGPIRALFRSDENGGRVIAVAREQVWEVTERRRVEDQGKTVSLGTVLDDNLPASISFNGTQYLILSGGLGYILNGDTLTQIADADFPNPVQSGCYLDSYFIVNETDTQKFYISAQNDGTSWNALEFASAESAPDNLKKVFSNHSELWLFGSERTEVWYNSGNVDFPFERIQGSLIEQGIGAINSVTLVGANSLMWLGESGRGHGVVWRAQGFQPVRASNHAVETAIQNYSRIDDAVAYSYQAEGHEFYVLNFPAAGATWVYDLASGMWHERGYWSPGQGYQAARGLSYVNAWGRHLVGDRVSGTIHEMSLDTYADGSDAIRRLRRSPHISQENRWLYHHCLVMDMEVGVGLQTGQGSDPQIMMRFSDDGGFNWSNTHSRSIGKVGKRRQRVQWNRLGRSRDRVYEFVVTDPVKVSLVDAYLEATPGFA